MSSKRNEFINPVRVFLAIVIVVLIWFAPIAFPLRGKEALEIKETSPLVYVFASSAGACPFACIKCTSWEVGVWPRGCLTWECDGGCEGDPGGGGENQPPTISHVLNCTQPGANGWCMGNLSLDLTASDPQGSQVIISGDINGVAFACTAATTCSISLPEGAGNTNYRVDASSTGLFAIGTTIYLLDSSTPQLNGSASGVVGTNGWYKSNVTLTVATSDAVSGIASTETTVDGGPWTQYAGPLSLNDGVHTVVLKTTDNAGHVTQTSQIFNIDTVTPVLDVALSGTMGANNWYISDVTITPSANDSGSGLTSLEVSADGGLWTVINSPLLFTDGIHSYQFRATDNAGNVTETAAQEIKVDATTPAISLKVNGTRGQNDWYVSDASVTTIVSDATSGIAALEMTVDGGPWTTTNNPLALSDGLHTYQYRVMDNAGNVTETPVQNLKVDTNAPVIEMMDELKLGETLYYDLEDPTIRSTQASGLWINRQVIEDDAEKYKKVVWQEIISGNKAEGDILWDGVFADGVKAEAGEYFITLKISDAAGNETMRTAIVKVNALSFFQIIPPFTPPQTTTLPAQTTQADPAAVTEFGGANSAITGAESASITAGGTAVLHHETEIVKSGFTQGNQSTSTPISNSNILWGAAATAMLGATLADWQRRREEEEVRKRAEAAAQEGGGRDGKKTPGQRAYEKMMKQKRIVGESQALLNEKGSVYTPSQKLEDEETNWLTKLSPVYQYEKRKEEAKQKAELQAGLSAYYEGRKAGEEENRPKEKTWWEKGLEWIDNHQPAMAVMTGIGVGLIAVAGTIALVGVAAITLPIVAVVAGAVILTSAALAGTGTIALNHYFERDLKTNVGQNMLFAAGTALIVGGLGLAVVVGCSTPIGLPFCTAVPGVVDTVEQISLQLQYAYQVATGNPQAGETYIELQFELNDGGAPGNTAAQKLIGEAAELVGKYGDEALPLLLKYGDDAVRVLKAVENPGLAAKLLDNLDAAALKDLAELDARGILALSKLSADVLRTSGQDAIYIAAVYTEDGIKLLEAGVVNTQAADAIMSLDDDIFDYVSGQGTEALSAFSKWKPEEIREFGVELALRAENDAKALTALDKLTKLDINSSDPAVRAELNRLIQEIADNSTQGNGERFVLGNWDLKNGIAGGYVNDARVNGGYYYTSHPDIYNNLNNLYGDSNPKLKDDILWALNQAALQKQIEKGVDFDYSMSSLVDDDYKTEVAAINYMIARNPAQAMSALQKDTMPARLKEVQLMLDAGYTPVYDEAAKVFHWTLNK